MSTDNIDNILKYTLMMMMIMKVITMMMIMIHIIMINMMVMTMMTIHVILMKDYLCSYSYNLGPVDVIGVNKFHIY